MHKFTDMNTQNKKTIIDIDLNLFEKNGQNPHSEGNIIGNDFSVITDTSTFKRFAKINQPYKINEARLFIVKQGQGDYIINFEDYHLQKGMILIAPADTVLSIQSFSDDFSVNAIAFSDTYLQQSDFSFVDSAAVFSVEDKAMSVIQEFFSLINMSISTNTEDNGHIKYLVLALLKYLVPLYDKQMQRESNKKLSRSEDILKRFLLLLKQTQGKQLRVDYFAEKLYIAPNHLSNVIKKTSSMTVMQYVNRYCVIQAKVLLKHSDMSVADIAQTLNFADTPSFSKFFKRHCNQTPLEYRNS